MATNVFHDGTSTIPKDGGDKRIVRIGLDKQDIGARKSHLAKIKHDNSFVIKHVKGS